MGWQADAAPVRRLGRGLGPDVLNADEPLLLRGLAAAWPAVAACRPTVAEAAGYLGRFWTDAPVTAYAGHERIGGRFFYDEDCTGFNFERGRATLADIMRTLADPRREARLATVYVGATPVDQWLPGFRRENDLPVPEGALASLWLGNETRISAHYDFPNNLACVVAGRRRFTLFPPEQIRNLYVGPLDRTPSGQAISLVDFRAPDLGRHPRFADAMQVAQVAVLEPGDALFIPGMWWHHVESLAPFNLLINYWWAPTPAYLGTPSNALLHAIMALRELPPRQRAAWRMLFDHYVFEADEATCAHIPEAGRGALAPLDEAGARRLRADLLNRLNR